ncbi:lytic murein transglycosylase [Halocynthiibacter sp. SDUM655004]|uniref:Lytic murein transglycosylase n=2 Tax=Paracoccaceae TaxID=31989 RepID=A0AAE3IY38_9RHOB|nr:lytic murein transglycosylase [Halocynthiibacter halioticoli]MCW4056042.1 lytic murein transglycosylase [Halocynthiibacter sp. SDUM655004]
MARPDVTGDMHMSAAQGEQGFEAWIHQFRARARGQGISDATLNSAFGSISYDADIVKKDRNQSEFTKQIWEYLDSATSDARVSNGKKALSKHIELLQQIEATYGVEKEIVAAVWGLESAYGAFRGDVPIIEALATLAYDGRRGRFFESQLIAALKILQAGDVSPSKMKGSWAGAMGHTQFMPTSYLSYAVDFTGDGKRDIWDDNPADALASTAAYLREFGWKTGQPWGVEVRLPKGFDYRQTSERVKKPVPAWTEMGVRDVSGKSVPNYGRASILLPAGAQGAAFMIFDNFHVIERYNTADAYVIGVGHLADRIAGGPPIKATWPRADRPLHFKEKIEMQQLLAKAGFDPQGTDGIIGPNTIAAIKAFQEDVGMVPDGYASVNVLKKLR